MNTALIRTELSDITVFDNFLAQLGLPTDNVLSRLIDRSTVTQNISTIVERLRPESKEKAVYLSRFAAAAFVGLFDAALNYVWDEVILSLRKIVVKYGVDYFFDNAIPSEKRNHYQSKEDLVRIQDCVLLKTCLNLEILDVILYKELSHILDMRNFISAAHPNTDSISGFQLLSFLEICVTKVIELEFSSTVIEVQSIIKKVKDEAYQFSPFIEAQLDEACSRFGTRSANSLLKTMFGIFVDQRTSKETRIKALKITKAIWNTVDENSKFDLGRMYDGYINELDEQKSSLAEVFLERVDGLGYLSRDTKIQKLTILSNNLISAHSNWDNYYHEVPIIIEIMNYIRSTKSIPSERFESLTISILSCRIGNGNAGGYNGVSPSAISLYDEYFSYFDESQVKKLFHIVISERFFLMYNLRKVNNIKEVFKNLINPGFSERVNEILEFVSTYQKALYDINEDRDFNRLVSVYLE